MSRFGGEEFFSVPGFDGNYDNDTASHFMYAQNRSDTDPASYNDAIATFNENATNWASEMTDVAGANIDGQPAFIHKTEDNLWRPINATNSGLDGWSEMHTSWVRISDDSTIEKGGTVKGDFQISTKHLNQTRLVVVV